MRDGTEAGLLDLNDQNEANNNGRPLKRASCLRHISQVRWLMLKRADKNLEGFDAMSAPIYGFESWV